jgi:hypothetical protein
MFIPDLGSRILNAGFGFFSIPDPVSGSETLLFGELMTPDQ